MSRRAGQLSSNHYSPLDWSDTFLSGLADPAPGLYPSFLSFRTMLAFAILDDFHSEIGIDKQSSEGEKVGGGLPPWTLLPLSGTCEYLDT